MHVVFPVRWAQNLYIDVNRDPSRNENYIDSLDQARNAIKLC